jgi:hypothetical protein
MNESDGEDADWTESQIDLIVADYFAMLEMDLRNESFNKAERNRALQVLTDRSRSSIEFKHRNISAVMEQLGLPWLTGYAPARNFQRALVFGVERYLSQKPRLIAVTAPKVDDGLSERSQLFLGAPPQRPITHEVVPPHMERLVRKFDPAARDARNRDLGKSGESVVYLSEIARLNSEGREDLARRVRWIAEEDGDGAGYDILSFGADGGERLLEVKTTTGGNLTPFFISENERSLSDERPDAFRLVRLYDFAREVRAFEIVPPLSDHLHLVASVWKASPA